MVSLLTSLDYILSETYAAMFVRIRSLISREFEKDGKVARRNIFHWFEFQVDPSLWTGIIQAEEGRVADLNQRFAILRHQEIIRSS